MPGPPPPVLAPNALARRALADGVSWLPTVLAVAITLAVLVGSFVLLEATGALRGLPASVPIDSALVALLAGALATLATYDLVPRWFAARELRRLRGLAWPLELDGYLARLGREGSAVLVVRVRFARDLDDDTRAQVEAAAATANVRWTTPAELEVWSPPLSTATIASPPYFRSSPTNAALHRWFRRRCAPLLAALDRLAPLASVTVDQ